ncbi:G-type lectin S-receptor-like serine/threonine-protein kinase RKS1 [Salvia splendens]|uniref:G-type lectin S-receptor-like serine/threonine-protein kinase RKS1 n=1 Tax=Salvia splendens TaxID=180675 RepID=UPI001C277346|nr:G-type lectin S-receptor-like serine/threonine-protein kinase RKS1 [Salvia splendens]
MLRTSRQGHEEFKSEVFLISKLQHWNLVKILGCCSEGDENILIYEYMHNKSLDYFIFGMIIIFELAFLLFSFTNSKPLTLADNSRSAALTWPKRFAIIMGIAKGLLYLHHDSRLKIIHSGYMAPEYVYQGKFSTKSDIFSLGVVILEIVTAKRNRSYNHPSCFQNQVKTV